MARVHSVLFALVCIAPVRATGQGDRGVEELPGGPVPEDTAARDRAEDTPAYRKDLLRGPDESLGRLAALRLVQAVAGESAADGRAAPHRARLREILDPASFGDSGPLAASRVRAARRVVEALAQTTAAHDPPFEASGDVLLALLGRGPSALRGAVVDALTAQVEWEAEHPGAVRDGGVKAAILRRVVHNPPPGAAVLADASRVLWRTDGRAFLGAAIDGMRLNRESFPAAAERYLREIRRRLRIDFASPDEWVAWWKAQEGRSLPQIFESCQRHVSEESARRWRAVLRALRETGDAKRVLDVLEETLVEARALELRLAAVEGLGEFAGWVRGLQLPSGEDGGEETRTQRDAWLDRGVGRLLEAVSDAPSSSGRSALHRAALVALRSYRRHLSRRPELAARAEAVVLRALEAAATAARDDTTQRADLLEALRTAGELHVTPAREPVEELLRAARDAEDLELLETGVAALGRIVQGELPAPAARLLVELHGLEPTGPRDGGTEATLSRLRGACLAALNARLPDAEVRDAVRALYRRTLEEGIADHRIRAILGLGTLAQGGDREALRMLVGVVARPEPWEPPAIVAAIHAIAYVGGSEVIDRLLPLVGGREALVRKDRSIVEQLWRKIVGLVAAGGVEALERAVRRLEGLAVERDAPVYVEAVARLLDDPELESALGAAELDPEQPVRLRAVFRAASALVRAREWAAAGTGSDDPPELAVRLLALAGRDEEVAGAAAAEAKRLERRLGRRETRVAAWQVVAPEGGDAVDADEAVEALHGLVPADLPSGERWFTLRWIERSLERGSAEDAGAPVPAAVVRGWSDWLHHGAPEGIWDGLPESFRARREERAAELARAAESARATEAVEAQGDAGGDDGARGTPPGDDDGGSA